MLIEKTFLKIKGNKESKFKKIQVSFIIMNRRISLMSLFGPYVL